MALRLRRGTDLERQSVIFAEGELVYTTDTKSLFVGDGVTLGGILISGDLTESPDVLTRNMDLNNYDITGSGDITISGIVTATKFVGDGSGLTNLQTLDVVDGGFYSINIVGADSSIILNRDTNTVTGNFFGDLTGSLRGSVIGDDSSIIVNSATNEIFGNFIGNGSFITGALNIDVIGNDSTVIIDSVTNTVSGNLVSNSISYGSNINFVNTDENLIGQVSFENIGAGQYLKFKRRDFGTASNQIIGLIGFDQIDDTGTKTYSSMAFWHSGIYIASSANGTYDPTKYVSIEDGRLCVGGYSAEAGYRLDVNGSTIVRGNLTLDNGVLESNTSLDLQAANGVKVVDSAFRLANITSTERAALTPENGDLIYNTTVNKIQAYQNGSWINLDDGSIA